MSTEKWESGWRDAVEAILTCARGDEPCKRYASRLASYGDGNRPPARTMVTSATAALGIRTFAALATINYGQDELRENEFVNIPGATEEQRRAFRAACGLSILYAPVYWWRSPILQALNVHPKLPTFTIGQQFDEPTSFHCFEDEDGWGSWRLIDQRGLGMDCLFSADDVPWFGRVCRWGDQFNGQDSPGGTRTKMFAMAAFLRSKYISRERQSADRGSRKQSATDLPEISVVTLRRSVSRAVTATASENGVARWRGRWWVSGHMRNQFYPSSQVHNPCWIAPYPKGPANKPFLPKIFSVSR